MSTIVVSVWPEPGHVMAPAALARRLQKRGHRIVFTGTPNIGELLKKLGFEFFAIEPGSPPPPVRFWPPPSLLRTLWNLSTWIREHAERNTDKGIAQFRCVVDAIQPDLVMYDSLLFWVALMAKSARIPCLAYDTMLPTEFDPRVPPWNSYMVPKHNFVSGLHLRWNWIFFSLKTRISRAVSRWIGIPATLNMRSYLPMWILKRTEYVTGTTVELDPRSAAFVVFKTPRVIFSSSFFSFDTRTNEQTEWIGPCVDLDRPETNMDWENIPTENLIFCSFGTQSARNRQALPAIEQVVKALHAHPAWHLILAAPQRDCASLRSAGVGKNVTLTTHVPQLAVLRRASAAIIHGGFNSLKECALLGVPMLVVPLSHDQPRNGALVEYLGIGLSLPPERVSAKRVSRALEYLMTSQQVHERCTELRQRMQEANRSLRGVELVESLISS
jgi:zeaxanthin glucosyltransferase